jgi:hypothetical protein
LLRIGALARVSYISRKTPQQPRLQRDQKSAEKQLKSGA